MNGAAEPRPPVHGSGSRPLRLIISNAVPLNGGDAAILEGLINGLRKRLGRDLRITVLATQPAVAARLFPRFDVEWRDTLSAAVDRTRFGRGTLRSAHRSFSRARFATVFALRRRGLATANALLRDEEQALLDLYADADFVVATGGTYLVENYSIASRAREFRVVNRLGLPLALFTQSMGPFGARSASMLRDVFDRSRLVLLRDESSLAHLRATGGRPARTAVVGDVGFTLADPAAVEAARTGAEPAGSPLSVAASVRDWHFFRTKSAAEGMQAVIRSFAALSEHLARRRARIEFLSTCQGVPEYARDDSSVARRVLQEDAVARLHADAVTVDDGFHTSAELMRKFGAFDLVVSMRMHAAILALAAGTPVLPIAYEPKTRDLFERMGFGDWVLDVETLGPDTLVRTFDRVVAELPLRRDALFAAVQEQMRSAELGLDLLADTIRESVRSSRQP